MANLLQEGLKFRNRTQSGQRARRLALDRADRAVQDLSGLRLGQIIEVAQHDDCPLPGGQSGQRAPDDLPKLRRAEFVAGSPVGQLSYGPFTGSQPSLPAGEGVHQDAPNVEVGCVRLDRIPVQP